MHVLKVWVLVLMVAVALSIGGCGGGGAKVETQTTTLGQELQDLDAAYKKGLLSQEEYNKTRKNIMERYTK